MFYSHHPVRITIENGSTNNTIRYTLIQRLGCRVTRSSQSVHQANGSSPLDVVGETRVTFIREVLECAFEGLVVSNLAVDILTGTLFMEVNDVSVRPARSQVIIGDNIISFIATAPTLKLKFAPQNDEQSCFALRPSLQPSGLESLLKLN